MPMWKYLFNYIFLGSWIQYVEYFAMLLSLRSLRNLKLHVYIVLQLYNVLLVIVQLCNVLLVIVQVCNVLLVTVQLYNVLFAIAQVCNVLLVIVESFSLIIFHKIVPIQYDISVVKWSNILMFGDHAKRILPARYAMWQERCTCERNTVVSPGVMHCHSMYHGGKVTGNRSANNTVLQAQLQKPLTQNEYGKFFCYPWECTTLWNVTQNTRV